MIPTKLKRLMTKKFLLVPVVAVALGAGILVGCKNDAEAAAGRDSDHAAEIEGASPREGREAGGEHGPGGEGTEGSGEHGSAGEAGGEGAGTGTGTEGAGGEGHGPGGEGGSAELNEAAMSSPVIPLDQPWDGVLGGLAVSARYDAATQTVHSTVQNTTSQTLCYVQAEPHLKSGTTTVGELGPDELGDLAPGQTATSTLPVASEPALAGVAFDGYVVHLEVFGEYLEPAVGQDLGRSGKAVKRDGITRLDLEDRRQRRVEDSPVNRPGTGMEIVMSSHTQSFPAEAGIGRPPVQAD